MKAPYSPHLLLLPPSRRDRTLALTSCSNLGRRSASPSLPLWDTACTLPGDAACRACSSPACPRTCTACVWRAICTLAAACLLAGTVRLLSRCTPACTIRRGGSAAMIDETSPGRIRWKKALSGLNERQVREYSTASAKASAPPDPPPLHATTPSPLPHIPSLFPLTLPQYGRTTSPRLAFDG